MNNKRIKTWRKEARKIVREDLRGSIYWFKRMPFRDRLGITFKILRGVKKDDKQKDKKL